MQTYHYHPVNQMWCRLNTRKDRDKAMARGFAVVQADTIPTELKRHLNILAMGWLTTFTKLPDGPFPWALGRYFTGIDLAKNDDRFSLDPVDYFYLISWKEQDELLTNRQVG